MVPEVTDHAIRAHDPKGPTSRTLSLANGRIEAVPCDLTVERMVRGMHDVQARSRRLQNARFLIRAELAIAFASPLVAGFLYIAAPGTFGGMFAESPLESALPWAAAVGILVGIVWMVRLSRPDPEAGERSWRYRDF